MAPPDESRELRRRSDNQRNVSYEVIDNEADRTYAPRRRARESSSDDEDDAQPSRPHARRERASHANSRRRINSESGDDDNGRSRRDIAPPSPVEREQNIEAMTSKQLRKAASLKRQQEGNNTTCYVEIHREFNAAGQKRWLLVAASSLMEEPEQFRVSKADLYLPHTLWLDEFTLLSKRKRREDYNNLFVNYCAEKKREMQH